MSQKIPFSWFKICMISLICSSVALLVAHYEPMDKAQMNKAVEAYILDNPEILETALINLQKSRQDSQVSQINDYLIDNKPAIDNPEGMFIGGNPDGDITVVEFFDYNCGYCKRSFADINLLLSTDKNVKIVMYELPILAQSSLTAARASLASLKQNKYWEFHSAVINNQGSLSDEMVFAYAEKVGVDMEQLKIDMQSDDVENALVASAQLAEALGVNGTPAFIIGDELFAGAIGFDGMITVIAEAREKMAAEAAKS